MTLMHAENMPVLTIWRGENARKKLPGYTDWLRDTQHALWCDVVTVQPRIILPWRYTREQEENGTIWECGAAWLHSAVAPNGEIYSAALHNELRVALDILKDDVDKARYTLLVNSAAEPTPA